MLGGAALDATTGGVDGAAAIVAGGGSPGGSAIGVGADVAMTTADDCVAGAGG
jgi:hypothetical protein